MKKILLAFAAGALILSASSCGNQKSENPLTDSLSTIAGESMGADMLNQYNMYVGSNDSLKNLIKKEDIIRGLKSALAADTSNQGFMVGYSIGQQALNFIARQNSSVPVDIDKFIEAFTNVLLNDSISSEQSQQYGTAFQEIMTRLQAEQMMKAQEAKSKSPEAVANKNAGDAYVKKMKEADKAFQTSKSGLTYKVTNPGSGDKVKSSDNVTIKYVGKLVDGTEFDKNEEGVTLPAGGFVPGFTEGLALLGKGGKATLIIPAELGYGVDGIPQANIGPNSTLVFEVEVVDVKPAAAAPAAPAAPAPAQ